MSKVLVDRELLERIEQWVQEDCTALEELQALLAQPAEAEGAGALDELLALFPLKIDKQAFVINGGAPLTADGDDEFLSFKKVDAALGEIRRLAEQGRAALTAVTAERDRLRSKWARVESERDRLLAEAGALRKDAERYQWLIKGTYDLKGSYWFPSLRSHDHQNPTEAIDAAMAAKEA